MTSHSGGSSSAFVAGVGFETPVLRPGMSVTVCRGVRTGVSPPTPATQPNSRSPLTEDMK
jgi:hypothetical protein